MINFLFAQQGGCIRHFCFLCDWDSRATDQHWVKKNWPARGDLAVYDENIINEPLVNRDRIILPQLYIKLCLMKQFVKALDKDGDCFNYIAKTFPGLSMEKLKTGIFDGFQICNLSCSMVLFPGTAKQTSILLKEMLLGRKVLHRVRERKKL